MSSLQEKIITGRQGDSFRRPISKSGQLVLNLVSGASSDPMRMWLVSGLFFTHNKYIEMPYTL